jgi:hypothetical protein
MSNMKALSLTIHEMWPEILPMLRFFCRQTEEQAKSHMPQSFNKEHKKITTMLSITLDNVYTPMINHLQYTNNASL